jgi:hypothetical protein
MPEALFKTKAVKIETLGGFLSQMRHKLNFDIRTVSMLTQIKPVYIEHIEAGNWQQLPAEVYIKGFLKQLAELYRLPEEDLVEQYAKETGFAEVKSPVKKLTSHSRVNITPKTFIWILTVTLTLGAIAYVGSQIRSVLAAPFLEIYEPTSDVTVEGNTLIISGKAEVGSDVSINNQAVLLDKNGQFTENLILSLGLNIIEVKSLNKFKKESRVVRKISASLAQVADSAKSLPVNISLEIGPESSWIYLEADGVVIQRGTMLAGSTKTISAKEEILLTSANAGSTKVIYNGKDLGKLGRDNEVIRNVEFSAKQIQ